MTMMYGHFSAPAYLACVVPQVKFRADRTVQAGRLATSKI